MTDEEFAGLLALKKVFTKESIDLPALGANATYDLESITTNDRFFLDVDRRGRIELSKYKLQNRYAKTKIPLVRIDINGPPHTNPDGRRVSRNHIHIYKETENDTGNLPWAYELNEIPELRIDNLEFMPIFYSICEYCHIITNNNVQGVL